MKFLTLTSTVIICLLLLGCNTTIRPISDSGYVGKSEHRGRNPQPSLDPAFEYRGELSEFDVLGITAGAIASENEIRRALDNARRVKLHSDSSVLLIQSGAAFPDGAMVTGLSKHFQVVPFSGIPPARPDPAQIDSLRPESYSRLLRLAAAKGGNDTIVCYWGILESETENLATKTVSWMPVVNWMLPDERQHMRIRLKVALIACGPGTGASSVRNLFRSPTSAARPGEALLTKCKSSGSSPKLTPRAPKTWCDCIRMWRWQSKSQANMQPPA